MSLLALLFLSVCLLSQGENELLSAQRVDQFIEFATSYLVRISHTDQQDPHSPGKFTYIAYLDEELQVDEFDKRPQKQYNLLRHNGAIYALAMAYDRRPDRDVKNAILRGVEYLKNEAIGPVPDTDKDDEVNLPDMLAPWEVFGAAQNVKKSKLGGAGLGLIALCSAERILPGTTDLSYIRKIGNFIEFLQTDDGSFASRFSSETGKDDSWTSLYYPGEAALGLVHLFELETDDEYRSKWLQVATDTLLYLERLRRYQKLETIEADHWALLATSSLLPHLEENTVEYWLVYSHALRVVQSMLASVSDDDLRDHNGCFSLDRRTCPTATRLEGLLASLSFIKEHEIFIDEEGHKVTPLRDRVLYYVELGLGLLIQAQQQTDQNNMKGAVPVRWPVEREVDTEVRVDYVQHSMSAVIAYEAFMAARSGTSSFKIVESFRLLGRTFLSGVVLLILATLVLLLLPKKKKSRRHDE